MRVRYILGLFKAFTVLKGANKARMDYRYTTYTTSHVQMSTKMSPGANPTTAEFTTETLHNIVVG
jgi:hypothetical protein